MAPKNKGENTKKVAGNAKKAEAAAQKQAAADKAKGQQEDAEWSKGAKSNSKAYAPTFFPPFPHHLKQDR